MIEIKKEIVKISKYFYKYLKSNLENDISNEGNNNLELAYQVAQTASEKYPANIWFHMYHIFFAIETDRKHIYIDQLNSFKYSISNYRDDNEIIAFYNFLIGLSDEKNKKKSEENLLSLKGNYEHLIIYMYMNTDILKSFSYLDKAFSVGCRSPILYFSFYKSFSVGRRYYRKNIMLSFLRWSNAHGILVSQIIETNSELIKNLIEDNLELFIDIYMKHKINWILLEICNHFAKIKNYSEQAYYLYKEVEQKQIFEEKINYALIYSAYNNDIDSIYKFSILSFIKAPIELDISPFIFHILLTVKNMEGVLKRNRLDDQIIQTVLNSKKNKISTKDKRYYNTIFMYVLSNKLAEKENSYLENQLFDDLFKYKITTKDNNIKYILLKDSAKKGTSYYEFENNICYIDIISSDFELLFFDKDKKVISKNINIEKMVELTTEIDFSIYEYFYKKGFISPNILMATSLYFIENDIESQFSLEIFDRTIKINGLSKNFRKKLVLYIGNILSKINNTGKALEYYKEVDESYINEKHIENMFLVFMFCKEYYLALQIIINKSQNLKEETLYKGILEITEHYIPSLNINDKQKIEKLLTEPIYELLLKGYYNEQFLELILNHDSNNVFELAKISNLFNERYINNTDLDKKLLSESIKVKNISIDVQQVFLRFYEALPYEQISSDFIYYICYQILSCDKRIDIAIINILEKLALENNKDNHLLNIALSSCLVYEETKNKENILITTMRYLDDVGTFLPVFAKLDAKYLTERQQTLFCVSYRAGVSKTIYLHILHSEPVKIPMKYFKFGIYTISFPMFYNEKIIYQFEDNVLSKEYEYTNTKILLKPDTEEKFFLINNSILYNELFKHEYLEENLKKIYKPKEKINFSIL